MKLNLFYFSYFSFSIIYFKFFFVLIFVSKDQYIGALERKMERI